MHHFRFKSRLNSMSVELRDFFNFGRLTVTSKAVWYG